MLIFTSSFTLSYKDIVESTKEMNGSNTYSLAHSKISITNFYSRQHHEKLFFDIDPNVIGSTSLNPKIVGGRHVDSLLYDISSSENPTSRTHFYFDSESNIGKV